MPTARKSFRLLYLGLALGLASLAAPAFARGGGETQLALRVSDAVGQPGGIVAVVVRTYAARPIKQGQVCFRPRRGPQRILQSPLAAGGLTGNAGDQPFAALIGALVFGPRGAVTYRAALQPLETMLTFASPAAMINRLDGPVAVLYLRLAADLQPGDTFTLDLDPADTFLVDEAGQPISILVKPGQLRIEARGESIELRAPGARLAPGRSAALGVSTIEARPFTKGQVGLRWDPAIQAAKPSVRMDARFGHSTFTVDRSTPGLLIVTFASPDASLNTVAGKFIEITLPTKASVPHGRKVAVRIDPNLTYLANGPDDLSPFTMKNGQITFN
ncbi:MAG: hypothetical protein ABJC13_08595 [Acidobacteriota bacterium]